MSVTLTCRLLSPGSLGNQKKQKDLAPGVSCDPDAVLQILVSQCPRPGSMWMNPDFLCTGSHGLPFNIRLIQKWQERGKKMSKLDCSNCQQIFFFLASLFKPLTKLQFYNFLLHLLHHYLVSVSCDTPSFICLPLNFSSECYFLFLFTTYILVSLS